MSSNSPRRTPSRFPSGLSTFPKELPGGNVGHPWPGNWAYSHEEFTNGPSVTISTGGATSTLTGGTYANGWTVFATNTTASTVVAGPSTTQVTNYGAVGALQIISGTADNDFTAVRNSSATQTTPGNNMAWFGHKRTFMATSFAVNTASCVAQIGAVGGADASGAAGATVNGMYLLMANGGVTTLYIGDGTTQKSLPTTFTVTANVWHDVQWYYNGAGTVTAFYRTRTGTTSTSTTISGWTSMGMLDTTAATALAVTGAAGGMGSCFHLANPTGAAKNLVVDYLTVIQER